MKIFKTPKWVVIQFGENWEPRVLWFWIFLKTQKIRAYSKIKEQPNTGLYNLWSIYCRILSFESKLTSEMNTSVCNKTLLWWQPEFILSNPKLALSVYHDLTFCSIQPHMKDLCPLVHLLKTHHPLTGSLEPGMPSISLSWAPHSYSDDDHTHVYVTKMCLSALFCSLNGWICYPIYTLLVWTPCLMHRCVISTMFGSCFSFFLKLLSFLFIFIFMCFLFLLLFCEIKIKCFFFTFVFLFIWMQVWSLEKEDTPHSFSRRVFLHYYKFYFFLFFYSLFGFFFFIYFFF